MVVTLVVIIGFIGSIYYITHLKSKKSEEKININYVPVESNLTEIEINMFNLINTYRASKSLTVLKTDELARGLCYDHCNNMINTNSVNHNGFVDRSKVLTNNGSISVGENVGYGFSTANGFVVGYLKSPTHKAILEGNTFTHVGIGCVKNVEGKIYNVLLFTNYSRNIIN
jgi:uncharacterized protein YkwD